MIVVRFLFINDKKERSTHKDTYFDFRRKWMIFDFINIYTHKKEEDNSRKSFATIGRGKKKKKSTKRNDK